MTTVIDNQITSAELTALLLAEHPRLPDYDPAIHISKEAAGRIWNMNPRNAMIRLKKMEEAGKITIIEVRNPRTNQVMQVGVATKQDDNNQD